MKQVCVKYEQVKLVWVYTERKILHLKVRFSQRKECSKYFKESESQDVLKFIKTEFQQWLDGKIASLQTKDVPDEKKKVSHGNKMKLKQISKLKPQSTIEKALNILKWVPRSKPKQTTNVHHLKN